jgi:hypothetical protein
MGQPADMPSTTTIAPHAPTVMHQRWFWAAAEGGGMLFASALMFVIRVLLCPDSQQLVIWA